MMIQHGCCVTLLGKAWRDGGCKSHRSQVATTFGVGQPQSLSLRSSKAATVLQHSMNRNPSRSTKNPPSPSGGDEAADGSQALQHHKT